MAVYRGFFLNIISVLLFCNSIAIANERLYELDEVIEKKASVSSATVSQIILREPIKLMDLVKAPLGFARNNKENERIIDFKIGGQTLRDTLNQLVRADPGYKWELRDGVINILPVSRPGDEYPGILSKKSFDEFVIEKASFYSAILKLDEEAKRRRIPIAPHPKNVEGTGRFDKTIHLNLKDASIIDILDNMIVQERMFDWLISENKGSIFIIAPRRVDFMDHRNKNAEENLTREGWQKQKNGTWYKPQK